MKEFEKMLLQGLQLGIFAAKSGLQFFRLIKNLTPGGVIQVGANYVLIPATDWIANRLNTRELSNKIRYKAGQLNMLLGPIVPRTIVQAGTNYMLVPATAWLDNPANIRALSNKIKCKVEQLSMLLDPIGYTTGKAIELLQPLIERAATAVAEEIAEEFNIEGEFAKEVIKIASSEAITMGVGELGNRISRSLASNPSSQTHDNKDWQPVPGSNNIPLSETSTELPKQRFLGNPVHDANSYRQPGSQPPMFPVAKTNPSSRPANLPPQVPDNTARRPMPEVRGTTPSCGDFTELPKQRVLGNPIRGENNHRQSGGNHPPMVPLARINPNRRPANLPPQVPDNTARRPMPETRTAAPSRGASNELPKQRFSGNPVHNANSYKQPGSQPPMFPVAKTNPSSRPANFAAQTPSKIARGAMAEPRTAAPSRGASKELPKQRFLGNPVHDANSYRQQGNRPMFFVQDRSIVCLLKIGQKLLYKQLAEILKENQKLEMELCKKAFSACNQANIKAKKDVLENRKKIIKLQLGFMLVELKMVSYFNRGTNINVQDFEHYYKIHLAMHVEALFNICTNNPNEAGANIINYCKGIFGNETEFSCVSNLLLELQSSVLNFNQTTEEINMLSVNKINNVLGNLAEKIDKNEAITKIFDVIDRRNYSQCGLLLKDGLLGEKGFLIGSMIEGIIKCEAMSVEEHARMQKFLRNLIAETAREQKEFRNLLYKMRAEYVQAVEKYKEQKNKWMDRLYTDMVAGKLTDKQLEIFERLIVADFNTSMEVLKANGIPAEVIKEYINANRDVMKALALTVIEVGKQKQSLASNVVDAVKVIGTQIINSKDNSKDNNKAVDNFLAGHQRALMPNAAQMPAVPQAEEQPEAEQDHREQAAHLNVPQL